MTRLTGNPTRYPHPVHASTGTPRPWTTKTLNRLLANPTYIGASVWGRTLAGRPIPPDQWIICRGAHPPIVSEEIFRQAQLLAPPATRALLPELLIARLPTPDQLGGPSGDGYEPREAGG